MLTLLALACVHAPAPVSMPIQGDLDEVKFLVGEWRMGVDGNTTIEAWLPPEGGMMFGTSQTIDDHGLTVFFEHLTVYHQGADVVYRAAPRGAGAAEFTLDGHGDNWAEFTNPAHDYPRRIRYERVGAELAATIDDGAGGQVNSWRFTRREK
jgi:hypothetical protein